MYRRTSAPEVEDGKQADNSQAPSRVYLLRHGESADPTVFHGAESDIGLSARGLRQAHAVAGVLRACRPTIIVSSAMQRARATAEPIAKACGVPIQIEPDLHERRVGVLSGKPFHVESGMWRETLTRWMAGETGFAPPGAESFDDIRNRVLPIWQRITNQHVHTPFVVVAHGVVCKVLLFTLVSSLSVRDYQRIGPIANAAITELIDDAGQWRIARLNELPAEVRTAQDAPCS